MTLPDGTADNYAELVARAQTVHVLVNTHGSGNVLSFFLPDGGALVEILPWNFHGKDCTWADQYYRCGLCVCVLQWGVPCMGMRTHALV